MIPVLSNRLKACCQFVRPGDRVADVGCDHGYLGIYLLLSGVARSVIAADVNTGPLDSARRNGEKYAVADRMTFCLSDGVSSLPRDFDCLVCAGMGADTMISILSAAPWLKDSPVSFHSSVSEQNPRSASILNRSGIFYPPGNPGPGRQVHLPRYGHRVRPRDSSQRSGVLSLPWAAGQRL